MIRARHGHCGFGRGGFTVAELLVAVAASSIILAALLTASIALIRSFDAMETYTRNQTASSRLMDAVAMDLRRAVGVSATTSATSNPAAAGNVTARFAYSTAGAASNIKTVFDGTYDPVNNLVGGRSNPSTYLTLTLPGYYQGNNPAVAAYRSPMTLISFSGGVRYGTSAGQAADVTVQYRKAYHGTYRSECFIRREGGVDRILAERAENLDLTITAQADNVFLVETSFIPTFSSARTATTRRVAGADRVMLRNPRKD